MTDEIHKNDIGTKFLITLKDGDDIIDISSATTKQIIMKKPTGVSSTKTALFYTDGTDGKLYYKTISGDLDTVGSWMIQAYVVLSDGAWKSAIQSFEVYDNL